MDHKTPFVLHGTASAQSVRTLVPVVPDRTPLHMGTHIAPFSAHARAHAGSHLDLRPLSFPVLLVLLCSHMHARRPSNCKQIVMAGGSHYSIQTLDLILQHPYETFTTYV
jgi:hypothetical protein